MKEDSNAFFKQTDQKWEVIGPKIKRQIIGYDPRMMMVKVSFEKGGVGSTHSHEHTQASYIAKGSFEVTIDNNTKVMGAGDSFFVGSNIPHGATCLEDGLLVDIFTPMREDFVK